MSNKVIKLTSQNFKTTVASATPTLVKFWAPWCGPCKAMAPTVEQVATDLTGKVVVTEVNIDESQELASAYGVRSVPTLLVFKNGDVVEQLVGIKTKDQIKKVLENVA